MRLFRSAMILALTLPLIGAAPAADPHERVLDLVTGPFVAVTINGHPMKLRVDFNAWGDQIALNPAAAVRARLATAVTRSKTIGSVQVTGSSRKARVVISSKGANWDVHWSNSNVTGGDADGVIAPHSLPENIVTLRLHRPVAGERTIELPVVSDYNSFLYSSMTVGRQVVSLIYAPQQSATIATASAAAHLADLQEGHWVGELLSINRGPFGLVTARPARQMALRRPLSLSGLPLRGFLVATDDFRGNWQLPSLPEKYADPEAIVVTGKKIKNSDDPWLTLHLGQDVLGGCSSISHDEKRKMLTLQCLSPPT